MAGRLVGTQALIPMIALMNGEKILSAKSEYTLLDPICRGLGVFSNMYSVVFDWAKDNGISCIWGFTSAVKPFQKAGFQIGSELYDEAIVVRPFSYAKRRFFGGQETVLGTCSLGPRSMASAKEGQFKLLRDESYFSYRYFENPYREILWFDEDRGVLYTRSCTSTDAYISEIIDSSSLVESISAFRQQGLPTRLVRRITTHPRFRSIDLFPSLYKRTASKNFIVYRWMDREAPIPEFVVDEGYTQGIA